MGKEGNLGLKSCTSKDGLDDSGTILKSQSSEEKGLDDSGTILKSQSSEEKEAMKKLTKSIEKLSENLQKVQEILLTNPEMKEEEEEEAPKEKFECGFSVPEARGRRWGNNSQTLLVKGLDSTIARDVIKSALGQHFGSCGEVVRVFVPIECVTKARLGFAFINMKDKDDIEEALALDGSYLGGSKLEVVMAIDKVEYFGYPYPNFEGCGNCRCRYIMRGQIDFFNQTLGYRAQRLNPSKAV